MRLSIAFAILPIIAVCLNADSIIPSARLFNWGAYTGVRGGIPYRTTVYTNMNAIDNTGATLVRTAFQNALNNCPSNQVISVPAGTYLIVTNGESANLTWDRDGITLRGAGPGLTTFVCRGASGGFSTINIQNGSHDDDFSSATKYNIWNASLVSGDSNISTTANHSFSVGDYVWMDQRTNTDYIFLSGSSGDCNFCSGSDRYASQRVYGQLSKVTAVSQSTNLVIEPPICGMFQSTNSPQIMACVGMVKGSVIDSITFSNASTATANYWFHIVGNDSTAYTNCEFAVSQQRSIQSINTIGTQIQQCYFHHGNGAEWSSAYQANYAYGVYLGYGSSFALVVDNIFYKLHVGVAFEGAISGNVAYGNFHTNQIFSNRYTSQSCLAHHGTSSHMNLWEHNNINATMLFDNIWAGGSQYTVFRNRAKIDAQHDGVDVDAIGVTVDMANQHRQHNIVGNVFGKTADDKVRYAQGDDPNQGSGLQVVYRIGYAGAFSTIDYNAFDAATTNSVIQSNNWNAVTAGVPTAENNSATLTNSYFYTSKPSWWGASNWPSIGPDKTPTSEMSMWIPAMGRFYAMNGAGTTNWFDSQAFVSAPMRLRNIKLQP